MTNRNTRDLHTQLAQLQPDDQKEVEDRERMVATLGLGATAFARSTLPGHFTGSALVVSPDGDKALLMHHRKLDRWLQFGGHARAGETNGYATALREAREESGLRTLYPIPESHQVLDVDIHRIPTSPREPAHDHLDLRYAFVASPDEEPERQESEVRELRWFAWNELPTLGLDPALERAFAKARALAQQVMMSV